MSQLHELSKPFTGKLVKKAAPGKYGDYVSHSTVNERLLSIVGPFSFEVSTVIRGYAPKIKDWPARENAIVGCLASLTCTIDGKDITVTECGTEDKPAMHNDAANLKNASSDAFKRCAMRLGLGLHLWSQGDYFLDRILEAKDEKLKKDMQVPEGFEKVEEETLL